MEKSVFAAHAWKRNVYWIKSQLYRMDQKSFYI